VFNAGTSGACLDYQKGACVAPPPGGDPEGGALKPLGNRTASGRVAVGLKLLFHPFATPLQHHCHPLDMAVHMQLQCVSPGGAPKPGRA
jgi:hypothetical protein